MHTVYHTRTCQTCKISSVISINKTHRRQINQTAIKTFQIPRNSIITRGNWLYDIQMNFDKQTSFFLYKQIIQKMIVVVLKHTIHPIYKVFNATSCSKITNNNYHVSHVVWNDKHLLWNVCVYPKQSTRREYFTRKGEIEIRWDFSHFQCG